MSEPFKLTMLVRADSGSVPLAPWEMTLDQYRKAFPGMTRLAMRRHSYASEASARVEWRKTYGLHYPWITPCIQPIASCSPIGGAPRWEVIATATPDDVHRAEVRQAIKDGQEVHVLVLADYPGIKLEFLPAWCLTVAEYTGPMKFVGVSDQVDPAWEALEMEHRAIVMQALADKLPVPARVMGDFPDLWPVPAKDGWADVGEPSPLPAKIAHVGPVDQCGLEVFCVSVKDAATDKLVLVGKFRDHDEAARFRVTLVPTPPVQAEFVSGL